MRKVFIFLLATAFPPPLGANPLNLGKDASNEAVFSNNIDMLNVFMTDAEVWPRQEEFEKIGKIPSWFHSDYKDVPYVHTWKFYQKICDLLK